MSTNGGEGFNHFPSTHWSLVGRAGHAADDDERRAALGAVISMYRPALRAHLVLKRRIRPDQADELLQAFLAAKVIEQDLLSRANHERGRFRSFLRTALNNFVSNAVRAERSQKRGAAMRVSLGVEVEDVASADARPEDAFDVAWAKQVLRMAIERMKEECRGGGRPDIWDVFDGRVLAPTLRDEPVVPYSELVERHGFESPSQASNVLVTANRRFARCLQATIARYERTPDDIEEEVAALHQILAKSRAGEPGP